MTPPLPPAVDLTGVDLTTEVLRTPRLVLRPPRQDDVDDLFRASQDQESEALAADAGALHLRRLSPPMLA